MTKARTAEQLARTWIEAWQAGEPDRIPLAEDFVHTSPFGRVEGRDRYLEWVKPLAAENVVELRVRRVLASADGTQAAIHFVMTTPGGPVDVCDWVVASEGTIREIRSFYDASGLK